MIDRNILFYQNRPRVITLRHHRATHVTKLRPPEKEVSRWNTAGRPVHEDERIVDWQNMNRWTKSEFEKKNGTARPYIVVHHPFGQIRPQRCFAMLTHYSGGGFSPALWGVGVQSCINAACDLFRPTARDENPEVRGPAGFSRIHYSQIRGIRRDLCVIHCRLLSFVIVPAS